LFSIAFPFTPACLPIEIFKIRAGKIHEIEAMGTLLPYGTASGWD
jgi:hypothetical protein